MVVLGVDLFFHSLLLQACVTSVAFLGGHFSESVAPLPHISVVSVTACMFRNN